MAQSKGGAGWLKGIVKEVVSGDTLVVVAAVKAGVPPEKRITLSSLMAPKLVCFGLEAGATVSLCCFCALADACAIWRPQGKRDGTVRDEPFAWASREFLRKKCIGQASRNACGSL